MKKIVVLLLIWILAPAAWAETRYVTDQCEITLRSGQSTSHKIISMLPSGTPLKVMETSDGYIRVKAANGKDGWVLERMTLPQPIAEQRLVKMNSAMANMEEENRLFAQEKESLVKQHQELQEELTLVKGRNSALNKELEEIRRTAANTLAIYTENEQLKERIKHLEQEMASIQNENDRLSDDSQRNWFMVGAGVLFGGILLGLIIPRMRLRKRSSWDSL